MVTDESIIAVYIMASGRNGTLYVGVTSALMARVWQHKTKRFGGFSAEFGCTCLVWLEHHPSMALAIRREKRVKHMLRVQKLRLIEHDNPEWRDLSDGWYEETSWDFTGAHEAGLR